MLQLFRSWGSQCSHHRSVPRPAVVGFESMEAAQAAFRGFAGHQSAKAFEGVLDVSSVQTTHWSLGRNR